MNIEDAYIDKDRKNGKIALNTGVLLKYSGISELLSEQAAEKSSKFHALSLQKALNQSQKHFANIALSCEKQTAVKSSSTAGVVGWVLALVIHSAVLYLITQMQSEPKILPNTATPITVSIIAPPIPEIKPEAVIVPIVKPLEVIKNPIVQAKKIVERIQPVESPMQPIFEATTEPVEQKEASVEEVAEPAVVKPAANPAPVEEKIEPPKFGVAYLNNPEPEYPKMAKRAGEEGRVLLRVLVSAEGLADTVSFEKSSGSERLDKAAIDAVRNWKFVPARKGGQALSAYVIVPINFSLE